MKTRIISSLLSLLFVSILTIEYGSHNILAENTSSEAVEYVLEKRITDKFMDATDLFFSTLISFNVQSNTLTTFKETFYTFTITNNLFRPPIRL